MFEQERAADAEVDALQLDKRHPPIVAVATLASQKTGSVFPSEAVGTILRK
jgi:hypothetical protein